MVVKDRGAFLVGGGFGLGGLDFGAGGVGLGFGGLGLGAGGVELDFGGLGLGLGGVIVYAGGGGAKFSDMALRLNSSFSLLESSLCGRAKAEAKLRPSKRTVKFLNCMILKERSGNVLLCSQLSRD